MAGLRLVALLLPALASAAEQAADGNGFWSATGGFARDTASDLGGYVTAPLRWDGGDWAIAGGVVAGTVALGIAYDDPARNDAQESRTEERNEWSRIANNGGTVYSLAVLGGFGLYSLVDDRPPQRSRRVLRDGLEATIIASGIVSPVIKYAAGRERPNKDLEGNDDWYPFSGNASFPSGHTTQAFAVASVIAANYRDQWWVGGVAYGLAATVGWARMNDNKHYLSDVLAGAVIGTTVGWYATLHEDARRSGATPTITPVASLEGAGVQLRWRF